MIYRGGGGYKVQQVGVYKVQQVGVYKVKQVQVYKVSLFRYKVSLCF